LVLLNLGKRHGLKTQQSHIQPVFKALTANDKTLNSSNPQVNKLPGSDAQISISSTQSVCH